MPEAGGSGPTARSTRFRDGNPESVIELQHAVNVIREAAQIKTPGVAEAAVRVVHELVTKELSAHLKEGDVAISG
jgi:hypothetical protein